MFLETRLFQKSGLPWAGGKERNGEKKSDFKRKATTSAALPKLLDGLSAVQSLTRLTMYSWEAQMNCCWFYFLFTGSSRGWMDFQLSKKQQN